MRSWLWRALLAGAVVALGVWLWTVLFPSPGRIIRKRLTELSKSVSFGSNQSPLAILAVGGFFTENVEIRLEVPGRGSRVINGRLELLDVTQWARATLGGLQVQFLDINLSIAADKQSAEANLTLRAKVAGERDQIVVELKLLLNKSEGSWKIQRLETIKTLSKGQEIGAGKGEFTF